MKEEAKADQWGSGEERRQQMSVGRGARGRTYGEAWAGPAERSGWGRGAGGWRDWFKGHGCWVSVPGRGFSFVCFAFPPSCVLCFLLAFPMLQSFGNPHY